MRELAYRPLIIVIQLLRLAARRFRHSPHRMATTPKPPFSLYAIDDISACRATPHLRIRKREVAYYPLFFFRHDIIHTSASPQRPRGFQAGRSARALTKAYCRLLSCWRMPAVETLVRFPLSPSGHRGRYAFKRRAGQILGRPPAMRRAAGRHLQAEHAAAAFPSMARELRNDSASATLPIVRSHDMAGRHISGEERVYNY